MAKRLPKRIYVETWPERAERDTVVHFEQTGYGVDFATGATSTITVYVREPKPKRKARRHGR